MKLFCLTMSLLLTSSLTFAAPATKKVLAKEVTHVGFAPPDYRGTYTTQILADGTVEKIDNKGQKKIVLKLSKAAVVALQEKISTLVKGELTGDDSHPGCMDAPSITSLVIKGEEEIVTKQTVACKTSTLYTEGSNEINQVISGAADIANALLR